MEQCRLIETGRGSAAWNMAVDEALMEGVAEGGSPVLRLYGWENALSFGRFSKPHGCLDLERAGENRIACVRRPSGGGVLVHGNDLSYTVVLPKETAKVRGVRENYRHLCRFLIRLYGKLGLEARFADGAGGGNGRPEICLAGHEPDDILIGGRKMGGNAQRHTSRLLFQHGTIPLSIDEALFAPFFRGESGLADAATLENLGVAMTREALAEMAAESFGETFATRLVRTGLSPHEENRARELMENKYSDGGWTYDGQQSLA
jgi:lipoate-protein ligase A